ncbi:glycosyltransferase family 39 protein [Pseudonocardia sp. ICBG601]|uniref:ArnT family glycosyltransferase n=1 Tax=Pseudonocardia sp. ICBG601 TaxID=2846759 RepID=UPI001CF6CED3|nr:glycosyltransferase family 39 protein [Pseudonocardia sp. ICBG601]
MTSTLDRDTVRSDTAPAPAGRGWARPASVAALLAGTAVLYLWNLSASGWANSFYAAAVQAGANDWTAFFFGSLDPANGITVDKPPASLWPMELAARIFGFSSWSLLVPQALMGVAAVGVLYAAVRRVSGHGAGLLAGALLALTPVAALMFRFDNPDAMLTLLMVVAAYLVVRGLQDGRTRWIAGAGLVLGLAFLTKSLQAFLVLPGMALAWAWAAPGRPWRRVWQLLVGGAGLVVGAGWWLLAVALWPVDARPYIGGSGDNTPLGLAFGYNGLGRITGSEGGRGGGGMPGGGAPGGAGDAAGGGMPTGSGMPTGGGMPTGDSMPTGGGMSTAGGMSGMGGGGMGGGPGGGGFGGQSGLLRMFESSFGTQISWLLPAALLLFVAALVVRGRRSRTDAVRGSLLLWGGWTLVTALVLSFMEGIVHPYYSVALAPGIAALIAIGGREVLGERDRWWARGVLAAATAGTAVWAFTMLGWSPEFLPWLRWAVLVVGVLAGVALLLPGRGRRRLAVVLGVAVLSGVAAPAAYAVQTAATTHAGSIPTAGPSVAGGDGGGGPGGRGGRFRDGDRAAATSGGDAAGAGATGRPGAGGQNASGQNGMAGQNGAAGQGGAAGQQGGGRGGPGEGRASAQVAALLRDAGPARWAAATIGSQSAASLMLAAGGDTAVLAIGGWSGSDEYPTLAQFQQYVHDGEIRYLVSGSGGGPGGDRGVGAEITTWVTEHYTATTVDGTTVYDLSAPSR